MKDFLPKGSSVVTQGDFTVVGWYVLLFMLNQYFLVVLCKILGLDVFCGTGVVKLSVFNVFLVVTGNHLVGNFIGVCGLVCFLTGMITDGGCCASSVVVVTEDFVVKELINFDWGSTFDVVDTSTDVLSCIPVKLLLFEFNNGDNTVADMLFVATVTGFDDDGSAVVLSMLISLVDSYGFA